MSCFSRCLQIIDPGIACLQLATKFCPLSFVNLDSLTELVQCFPFYLISVKPSLRILKVETGSQRDECSFSSWINLNAKVCNDVNTRMLDLSVFTEFAMDMTIQFEGRMLTAG
jgi:hypothetical protein